MNSQKIFSQAISFGDSGVSILTPELSAEIVVQLETALKDFRNMEVVLATESAT